MQRSIVSIALLGLTGSAFAQTVGFVQTFTEPSGATWNSNADVVVIPENGADGPDDPFLSVSRSVQAQLGVASSSLDFTGNMIAAGATAVSFELLDIGQDDDLTIHMGTGNNFSNFWTYSIPAIPTDGVWTTYTVPLVDDGNWVQIQGSGTFEEAISNVDRINFRHDTAPFVQFPEPIIGDFGIDNISLLPAPGASAALLMTGALVARRRR